MFRVGFDIKYLLVAMCVIFVCLFLIVRIKKGGVFGLLTKILASLMFVITSLYGLMKNPYIITFLVCIGLILGMIGDIILDLKVIYKQDNDIYLNSGIASFGIGHIFYISALILCMTQIGVFELYKPLCIGIAGSIVLSIIILSMTKLMKLNFGKFFWQSAIYTLLLVTLSCLSVIFAIWYNITHLWLLAIGGILILISDLILSLNYFGGKENNKILIILNHLIYYIGQILIACFVLFF